MERKEGKLIRSDIVRGAKFIGPYRYELTRRWGSDSSLMLACMLNPSKAGTHRDDATTGLMTNFAHRWGYRYYVAVNLHALVDTDPQGLYLHDDPTGPLNDEYIMKWVERANIIICAWGNHGAHLDRGACVFKMISKIVHPSQIMCFGVTKQGHPRFPRAIARDTRLRVFHG